MRYTVYFEIYGKKMKTTVEAFSPDEAERKVRDRLVILKCIQEEPEESDENFDFIRDVFGKYGIKL